MWVKFPTCACEPEAAANNYWRSGRFLLAFRWQITKLMELSVPGALIRLKECESCRTE
jgi:hypothetical protein